MASVSIRGTTPPPTSAIHEPPAPKHGWEDNYEPYSPRKSSRVSARQQRAAHTPPPAGRASHSSPVTIKRSNMPASPPSTIAKKGGRRISGALDHESTASAAAALGIESHMGESKMDAPRSTTAFARSNGMLPTPDKTPKKRPTQAAAGISSIARNLFPIRPESIEEVMPSPRKKGTKYKGFTMDSFGAEEEAPIQIFTDSSERIPEVDMSADNPFYNASAVLPEPTKRASKRRKLTVPGEGEQTIEQAGRRDDGLVYVFRGKKIFRKFDELDAETGSQVIEDEQEDDVDAELSSTVPSRLRGPLTRSGLKPRLLFPTAAQLAAKKEKALIPDEEEEAITDIEDSTAMDLSEDGVTTPKAPKFAPASPPTTGRATRSIKKAGSSSPATPGAEDRGSRSSRGGKVSPFDGWRRVKGPSPILKGKKRMGDALTRSRGESSKRTRGQASP